ncbi:MAG: NADH-quinone oxidoreductase subunit L [Candidatus Promineifilaceae bacterium]|nr:NADH-quinone oxidoreductase subunit L [Candidatus Promineifilaceae bacterium]
MSEETLTLFTWLVPAGPLLAFFLIILLFNRNKTLSWITAWAGIFASLFFGWTVALTVFFEGIEDLYALAHHPEVIESAIAWLPFGESIEGWLFMGVMVDPLTAVMLFMVPFATAMILVYSVGYHRWGLGPGDHVVLGAPNHAGIEPLFARFFALMSLFAGGMLALVVSDNLLLLFMGWEIMGLCSYMLIGFWYAREYEDPKSTPPRRAAVKAFMTTRAADVVMLLGIVFFYRVFGTLNFSEALSAESLATAADVVGFGALGLMALFLFTGTVGKSAQWPLHVWLPDAMEGPTPVSAVIHAAAMVSAGVYLIVRIFPLIAVAMEGLPVVGIIIAGIGAFTAIMAATIALAQYDVKRVLAYSTISQLGFMVAAIGIGAYVAAAFHLITHAFFKALLFLGSGSIIHGMEYGAEVVHDHHTDPQDMRNMGGLRHKMPITFWTFVAGGFALAGFPFVTAGFWSKDEIFAEAWFQGTHGNPMAIVVFIVLAIAALLTAFYTARQIALTFLGEPRTELAEHAHESDAFMTIPLVLLSLFAIAFGWLGIPDNFLGTDGIFYNYFHHFVGVTVEERFVELNELGIHVHEIATLPWEWLPLITSLVVALGGLFLGWWVYGRDPLAAGEPDPMEEPLGPVWDFLYWKWYWDELYHAVFVEPVEYFSDTVVYQLVDKGLIDGTLHLIGRGVYGVGAYFKGFEETVISDGVDAVKDGFLDMSREMRTIQSGKLQEYVLVSAGIASVLAILILAINFDVLNPVFEWWNNVWINVILPF